MASSPFTTPPASFHARFDPQLFRVLLLRRLWQPLPPVSRICRCGRPLDSSGHHRAACANSGVLGRGGFAVESAVARVCREAGGRVSCNAFVRDLDVGCASRGRWETLGSGDRWLSTFSWRSVGLGCHHGVCIAVRWNPTQACSGRGWSSAARSSTLEGTHVSPTHRGGLGAWGWREMVRGNEQPSFCSLQRPTPTTEDKRQTELAVEVCAAAKEFAQSLLEQRGGTGVDGPTPSLSEVMSDSRH